MRKLIHEINFSKQLIQLISIWAKFSNQKWSTMVFAIYDAEYRSISFLDVYI
jgi:hypothetical protein